MGSIYKFTDQPRGFEITAEHRPTITVSLECNVYQWIIKRKRSAPRGSLYTQGAFRTFGCDLLNFHRLIQLISVEMNLEWKKDKTRNGKHWFGVRDWATNRTAQALNHRVLERYYKLIEEHIDPQLVAVLKRIFSVTHRVMDSGMTGILARSIKYDPLLIADIMNHRAACFAMCMYHWDDGPNHYMPSSQNWTRAFCGSGGLTTTLRKTMMNLPHGMSPMIIRRMAYVNLERPIYEKLPLTWALVIGSLLGPSGSQYPFMYTTKEDLYRAADRWGKIVEDRVYPGRSKTYSEIGRYIYDSISPETEARFLRARTANAALQIAEDWHRNRPRIEFENYLKRHDLDPTTPTSLPPIPLPEIDGVRFLATVQDVFDESMLMDHCVDAYSLNAVRGKYYLFHVEHEGEMATVSVTGAGRVSQSSGPCNKRNGATEYGVNALSTWGAQMFRQAAKKHFATDSGRFLLDNMVVNIEQPHGMYLDEIPF